VQRYLRASVSNFGNIFEILSIKHMNVMKRIALLLITGLLGSAMTLSAQDWGSGGDGWGSGDSTVSMGDSGWDEDYAAAEQTFPKRFDKHQRFIAPYDSLRELIYYSDVVEDPNCEECSQDSLYWRTMRYLENRFGKKELKTMLKEAKPGNKITVLITVPLITMPGNNIKVPEGKVEYKLIVRFQDNRYKYEFSNFVHTRELKGATGGESRTYAEYYREAKTNTRVNDLCLMGMDSEVKKTVADLRKSLREKWKPEDEDDW